MAGHFTRSRFTQMLLTVMDGKQPWAWEDFVTGRLTTASLKIHFQHEYAIYVRGFLVFLARIHGNNPSASVRRMLAKNIYEEDTGGLSLGTSHPALFLSMMEGLRFRSQNFEHIRLLPAARPDRAWLDRISNHRQWVLGAAALTVFAEGSVKDRAELAKLSKPKNFEEIEAVIARHPLVRYHNLSPDRMDLMRAQQAVLTYLKKCLTLWLAYHDAVAKACGIIKP